jgi:hypothetical protein
VCLWVLFANGANEAELLELAHHATSAEVKKLVHAYRSVNGRAGRLAETDQAMARHAVRELNYYHDDDGSLAIRARLPAEEGAVVLQALNSAMDAQFTERNEDAANDVTAVTSANENRFAQHRADALTTMAETALRQGHGHCHGPGPQPSSERYQVVVHSSIKLPLLRLHWYSQRHGTASYSSITLLIDI